MVNLVPMNFLLLGATLSGIVFFISIWITVGVQAFTGLPGVDFASCNLLSSFTRSSSFCVWAWGVFCIFYIYNPSSVSGDDSSSFSCLIALHRTFNKDSGEQKCKRGRPCLVSWSLWGFHVRLLLHRGGFLLFLVRWVLFNQDSVLNLVKCSFSINWYHHVTLFPSFCRWGILRQLDSACWAILAFQTQISAGYRVQS